MEVIEFEAEGVEVASPSLVVWGPRPSLMIARESGMSLVCQPLSPWNFCMAASVSLSQWPLASPVRYPALVRAVWISVARTSSMARLGAGFAAALLPW